MTGETFNIRAVRSSTNDAVVVYHAVGSGNVFNISAERYIGKRLMECSFFKGIKGSLQTIDALMLEFCLGCLEPCHLKDVMNDMCGK